MDDVQVAETMQSGQQNDQTQQDLMIPKTRFDKINNKYKELQSEKELLKSELEDYQYLYKSTEEKANELSGQIKGLEKDIKARESRIERLEKTIDTLIQHKLSNIPEEYHDLIPENLAVEEKLLWVAKAEEKGLFSSAINVGLLRIGEQTNSKPSKKTSKDLGNLSPMEMLLMGYTQG